jgi:predicted PurR-regulated permease PerM
MHTFNLSRAIQVLLFLFLLFAGLFYAKEFLVPLTIAGILAMLFLPLCRKLESKNIGRGFASVISVIILVAVLAGIVALLSWQMSDIAEDASKIKQHLQESLDKLMQSINENFGVSRSKQTEMLKKQQESAGGGSGKVVSGVLGSISGVLVNFVLVLVYIFLLLFFRNHLKKFVLKLAAPDQKTKTEKVINQSSLVAQKYLTGLGTMIVMLWVMYGIGFSIVGVKSALFFALLCGILEIIPFVGNLLGTSLTLLMVFAQGGSSGMIIGVLITYATVQFIQTYILEPLVVGAEVNINPLFTIIVIVVGEMVWGVPGMILAIPLLGIVKIICDNVEGLQPYGFLIGKERKEGKEGGFIEKIKKKLK